MFVTSAISAASCRNERSDSSASTTSQSPVPQPAFVPVVRSSPPMTYDGSQPARISACAAIEAVVVLPCVPAIAIVRRSRDSSPSSSPRWISRRPRARATARSGFEAPIAVETTSSTSSPAGTFAAS